MAHNTRGVKWSFKKSRSPKILVKFEASHCLVFWQILTSRNLKKSPKGLGLAKNPCLAVLSNPVLGALSGVIQPRSGVGCMKFNLRRELTKLRQIDTIKGQNSWWCKLCLPNITLKVAYFTTAKTT